MYQLSVFCFVLSIYFIWIHVQFVSGFQFQIQSNLQQFSFGLLRVTPLQRFNTQKCTNELSFFNSTRHFSVTAVRFVKLEKRPCRIRK